MMDDIQSRVTEIWFSTPIVTFHARDWKAGIET